jgi:hypothetical protein
LNVLIHLLNLLVLLLLSVQDLNNGLTRD